MSNTDESDLIAWANRAMNPNERQRLAEMLDDEQTRAAAMEELRTRRDRGEGARMDLSDAPIPSLASRHVEQSPVDPTPAARKPHFRSGEFGKFRSARELVAAIRAKETTDSIIIRLENSEPVTWTDWNSPLYDVVSAGGDE